MYFVSSKKKMHHHVFILLFYLCTNEHLKKNASNSSAAIIDLHFHICLSTFSMLFDEVTPPFLHMLQIQSMFGYPLKFFHRKTNVCME